MKSRASSTEEFWREGSDRALDSHIDIVREEGFTEENRGLQHVRAYISVADVTV